jgi:hypothetical protein
MGNVFCTTASGVTDYALTPPKVVSQPGNGLRSHEWIVEYSYLVNRIAGGVFNLVQVNKSKVMK